MESLVLVQVNVKALLAPPPQPAKVSRAARDTIKAEEVAHLRTSPALSSLRALSAAARAQRSARMVYGSGKKGVRGQGRRSGPGGKSPRAVVVTVILKGAGEAPLTFTDEAEGVQLD